LTIGTGHPHEKSKSSQVIKKNKKVTTLSASQDTLSHETMRRTCLVDRKSKSIDMVKLRVNSRLRSTNANDRLKLAIDKH